MHVRSFFFLSLLAVFLYSAPQAQAAGCAVVPTLMYHHIQVSPTAKAGGYMALNVEPKFFQQQMQYLRDKHFTVVKMQDVVNFFNSGTPLPSKPVLLTFDDGYADFSTQAVPILNSFGYAATLFDATGLSENPGYLTWNQVKDASNTSRILIANHTWSHHSMNASNAVIEREVSTAENQLHERGLDNPKIFAYPYGSYNGYAKAYLAAQGFQMAFTTHPGKTLCSSQRMELPRVRIGNAQLNLYGLH